MKITNYLTDMSAHIGVYREIRDQFVAYQTLNVEAGLRDEVPQRLFHFDSIHALRDDFCVINGDRRLSHPGNATEVGGIKTASVSEYKQYPDEWVRHPLDTGSGDAMLAAFKSNEIAGAGWCPLVHLLIFSARPSSSPREPCQVARHPAWPAPAIGTSVSHAGSHAGAP